MDRYTISFDMENRTKNQEYFILEELEEVLKTHLSLKYASKVEHLLPPRERAENYFKDQELKIRNDYGESFEKYKALAFMKNPTFGWTERGIALQFRIILEDGGAASHWAFYPEYEYWITLYKASAISSLHDRPVWVINQGNGKAMFPIRPIII